jgi:hypothetical protein
VQEYLSVLTVNRREKEDGKQKEKANRDSTHVHSGDAIRF